MRSSVRRIETGAFIVVAVASLLGCRVQAPSTPTGPAAAEGALFRVVSDFYCTYRGWPTKWEDLLAFLQAQANPSGMNPGVAAESSAFAADEAARDLERLQELPLPTLSVARAIALTMTYSTSGTDEQGSAGPIPVMRRVTFIAPPACGEGGDPEAVSMAGGRVVFRIPDSFSVLSPSMIKERWKNPPFPDVAWSDSSSDSVVAVRFGEAELKSDTAKKFKKGLESAYEISVPGLTWISRKIEKEGKRPVLFHEFESDSSRGRLITAAISLPFDDKLLSLNVVGPARQREWVSAVASQLKQTLIFPSE